MRQSVAAQESTQFARRWTGGVHFRHRLVLRICGMAVVLAVTNDQVRFHRTLIVDHPAFSMRFRRPMILHMLLILAQHLLELQFEILEPQMALLLVLVHLHRLPHFGKKLQVLVQGLSFCQRQAHRPQPLKQQGVHPFNGQWIHLQQLQHVHPFQFLCVCLWQHFAIGRCFRQQSVFGHVPHIDGDVPTHRTQCSFVVVLVTCLPFIGHHQGSRVLCKLFLHCVVCKFVLPHCLVVLHRLHHHALDFVDP
mmetsp:Transcript_28504/g.80305  ORF Transcript_28504/g.80305 Transcript_28504/m.80305 type:complete len:250 (+) Transcript_28504:994-1743(+)